jgi:hypothetical protein
MLYINGMAAEVVKKTIIRLACVLNTHKLRNIDTLQNIAPSKNSLPGVCSALKGEIKDSKTMLSPQRIEYIKLLMIHNPKKISKAFYIPLSFLSHNGRL